MVRMSNDTTETTALETVVDAYLETWNETDAAKRGELIDRALGADLWYRDPMLEADGLEAYDGMIAAVQSQFPGLVMRRTSAVDLGDVGGKLHRIIGFAGETIAA